MQLFIADISCSLLAVAFMLQNAQKSFPSVKIISLYPNLVFASEFIFGNNTKSI